LEPLHIDLAGIARAATELERLHRQLTSTRQGVASMRYPIDPPIAARRMIGPRMEKIDMRIREIEERLLRLRNFADYALARYRQTESDLARQAGTVSHPLRAGAVKQAFLANMRLQDYEGHDNPFEWFVDLFKNVWGLFTRWLTSDAGHRFIAYLESLQREKTPLELQLEEMIERYDREVPKKDIRTMQELLKSMNIYSGDITGSYNADFLYAVFFYQHIVDTHYFDKVEMDGKITAELIRRAVIDEGLDRKATWIDLDVPAGSKTIHAVAQGFSLAASEWVSDVFAASPLDPYFYTQTVPELLQFGKMVINGAF